MTADNTTTFPHFEDGDVTIVVSTSRVYRLHSYILRQTSPFFRDIFETYQAPRLVAAARRAGYTPWRIQLVDRPSTNPNDPYGRFIVLPVGETGRVQGNTVPSRGPTAGLEGEDRDRCWDWLFGCFYGITPRLDSSTFAATVRDCVTLIDVADTIGPVEHVYGVVDRELMQQDRVLWKSIARSPIVWAELGRRIKSPSIFKEAIIHIVGRCKMLGAEDKSSLPHDTLALCQKKHDELELAKRAIEIRIAGHYPPHLCRNHADKPHRTGYAVDIYSWMALSYFRQFVSQAGNDSKNRQADDGGYAWYRAFADGGHAYLDHDTMRTFHQFSPISSKACSVLEGHMNVLKDQIKVFVKDIMTVRTHVDPATLEGIEMPWLTCTVVEKGDMPWVVSGKRETAEQELTQQMDTSLEGIEDDADDEAV